MEISIEGRGDIDTYSNGTQKWPEAQMKYAKLKGELERQIGISIGSAGIRGKLDSWGEDRQATLKTKEMNQSGINRTRPQISEDEMKRRNRRSR